MDAPPSVRVPVTHPHGRRTDQCFGQPLAPAGRDGCENAKTGGAAAQTRPSK